MINTLHHFLVQYYPAVTGMVPDAGVSVLLTGTPLYGATQIQVFGDGVSTIAQLYAQYLTTHTGSGDLQTQLNAEAQARGQADTLLQNAITALGQLLQTELADEVAALIQAIALKANIHAPHFTGIPETPTPDYSNPLQILNVHSFDELKYIITLFAHDDYMEYSN